MWLELKEKLEIIYMENSRVVFDIDWFRSQIVG